MTLLSFVLAAFALGEGTALPPGQADPVPAQTVVTPGQPGYTLKRTREMVELARSHNPDRRADLFLHQAQERLREREALGSRGGASGLGECYDRLLSRGAAGSIECGAAEGHDMSASVLRLESSARLQQGDWSRVTAGTAGQDREADQAGLRAAESAGERARESQKTGQAFYADLRAQEEALERERRKRVAAAPQPPPPPPPAPPPPVRPPAPPTPAVKPPAASPETVEAPRRAADPAAPDADSAKKDSEKKDPDKDAAAPPPGDPDAHSKERHQHMPHHSHR